MSKGIGAHAKKVLLDGKVEVENCSNCWKKTEDDLAVDVMVCHLLFYIFLRYQEQGEIPEVISYNV